MGRGAPRNRDPHGGGGLQARPGTLDRSSEARSELPLVPELGMTVEGSPDRAQIIG